MAKPEHVAIVKQGAEAILAWREHHESGRLDLSAANLNRADLREANLSGADLHGARMVRADLRKADLTAANLDGVDLTASDLGWARLVGSHLTNAILRKTDFSNADLRGGRVIQADLRWADLRGANLTDAQFSQSTFRGADLRNAKLHRTALRHCDLGAANLRGAELSGADLRFADLQFTDLSFADMSGADMSGACFGETVLASNNLSAACGLDKITHAAPSALALGTLRLSGGKLSEVFLRGCGLSDWEIAVTRLYSSDLMQDEVDRLLRCVRELRTGAAVQVSSLFISYSHADTAFVDMLESRLNLAGIRFWRDVHDIKAGRVEKQLVRAISLNPTVLLVLSENSVKSDWVEWEAAKARELERSLNRDVLCPVALDDAWRNCDWPGPLRRQIEDYHILDFFQWRDAAIMDAQFRKLLDGLRLFYRGAGLDDARKSRTPAVSA